jgi:hypothetical protein
MLSMSLRRLRVLNDFLGLTRLSLLFLSLTAALVIAVVSSNLTTTHQYTDKAPSEDSATIEDIVFPQDQNLAVPYVPQGTTRWCFETALSMVMRYYGETVSPSDIAEGLGAGPNESVSILDMFLGSVDSFLATWPQFSVQRESGDWGFPQYAEEIDTGTPIIVSTFGLEGHTVVVVGYSREPEGYYIHVHDPSGYYSKLAWGTNRNVFARVKWSVFSKNHWTQTILTPIH